jgi:hypothetical protein
MVVWGGYDNATVHADGATYDSAADTWTVLPPAPLVGRCLATAAVADDVLIVWGGVHFCGEVGGHLGDGAMIELGGS